MLGWECHPQQGSQRQMEQSGERGTWSEATADKWGNSGTETCQRRRNSRDWCEDNSEGSEEDLHVLSLALWEPCSSKSRDAHLPI